MNTLFYLNIEAGEIESKFVVFNKYLLTEFQVCSRHIRFKTKQNKAKQNSILFKLTFYLGEVANTT